MNSMIRLATLRAEREQLHWPAGAVRRGAFRVGAARNYLLLEAGRRSEARMSSSRRVRANAARLNSDLIRASYRAQHQPAGCTCPCLFKSLFRVQILSGARG